MEIQRMAFVHHILLHYHYPRLSALAKYGARLGILVQNIQLSGYSSLYQSLYQQKNADFDNFLLFPDQAFDKIPPGKLWDSLQAVLYSLKPDVVFTYGYSLGVMRKVVAWAERNAVATVLISDSNWDDKPRYAIFEWLKSRFVTRYDAAFVAGQSASDYLVRLGLPKERMALGYDVVDNDFLIAQNKENRKKRAQICQKWGLPENYFLFVGRLVWNKNVHGLIRAYQQYSRAINQPDQPWQLVICGDGPDAEAFRSMAAALPGNLRSHIKFTGMVLQPELIELFSNASCLILPSIKNESWGLVVNEALACGLPVIVSNLCGCAADLVVSGINGWVFNPLDPEELVRQMLKMHRVDSAVRNSMMQASLSIASEWGLERFTNGALASARLAVRHRLLKHSSFSALASG